MVGNEPKTLKPSKGEWQLPWSDVARGPTLLAARQRLPAPAAMMMKMPSHPTTGRRLVLTLSCRASDDNVHGPICLAVVATLVATHLVALLGRGELARHSP
eukprot:CAMPEP_0175507358 /NCGR_PEP_ID=MMETSP0096-20121207/9818_1 /TAXON_ID=311494 /ORGANISM="Alexandrium monilatum, Strain CCMP3105" /LENGTH=100 /DNA_ID=CAMNT_0016809473 /DNA_START=64 /DNA_END=366 /DNA_ORIENTATION=-